MLLLIFCQLRVYGYLLLLILMPPRTFVYATLYAPPCLYAIIMLLLCYTRHAYNIFMLYACQRAAADAILID